MVFVAKCLSLLFSVACPSPFVFLGTKYKVTKMESCLAVGKEEEKLSKKYKGFREHTEASLEETINNLTKLRDEMSKADPDSTLSETQLDILCQNSSKVENIVSRVAGEHKELHGALSKIGKSIDRNFVQDNTGVSQPGVFDNEKFNILNEVLCQHFFRQGRLEIGESLMKEANLNIGEAKKLPFTELNFILDACRQKCLDPALRWAREHRAQLEERGSSLEFKLHRLKYIDLVVQGNMAAAISYARNFVPFSKQNSKEIQQLMACLAFCKWGLEDSPYACLLDPINWIEICEIFTRDACGLLGLSLESPLEVCVTAGCLALPSLLQIKQVMQQRQCSGVWTCKEELPIEIDLGSQHRYHSLFACPILRQQCTDSNPPERLLCGHVISRDALTKLTNGNKIKCPYCPKEMSPGDARELHFY